MSSDRHRIASRRHTIDCDDQVRKNTSYLNPLVDQSIRLSVRLSVHKSVCPSIHQTVSLLSHQSVRVVHLSVHSLPVCPSARLPVCPSAHPPVCPSAHLPVHPFAHLSINFFVRLSVYIVLYSLYKQQPLAMPRGLAYTHVYMCIYISYMIYIIMLTLNLDRNLA